MGSYSKLERFSLQQENEIKLRLHIPTICQVTAGQQGTVDVIVLYLRVILSMHIHLNCQSE
jgi:hypothetical protein